MKKTNYSAWAVLGICLFLMAQSAYADVDLDDFSISLSEEEIGVGGSFDIDLTFEGPDNTESIDLKIEIKADGETVFLDKDYRVSFTEDEDKTITIGSDDFPGADLEHDYFNDNLMNYICDEVEVEVFISGSDLDGKYDDSADLEIGADDEEFGSVKVSPSDPDEDEEVTVTVTDEDDDDLEGAKVKVTWIDDPDGDEEGEWDSDDESWSDETDDDGEVDFTLEDEFDNPEGEFQIDVYAAGYCLERKTISTTKKTLLLSLTPSVVTSGATANACVSDSTGKAITSASITVYGTGYSKIFKTGSNGCVSISISGAGQYQFTATASGYSASPEGRLTVNQPTTTTITTTTTTTTTTSPQPVGLTITVPAQTQYVGEQTKIVVTNSQGNPVEGVRLTIAPSNTEGVTDSRGEYYFTPQTRETYTVSLTAGAQNYAAEKKTIEVTDKPAETKPGPATTQPIKPAPQPPASDNGLLIVLGGIILLIVIMVVASTFLGQKKGDKNKKQTKLFTEEKK